MWPHPRNRGRIYKKQRAFATEWFWQSLTVYLFPQKSRGTSLHISLILLSPYRNSQIRKVEVKGIPTLNVSETKPERLCNIKCNIFFPGSQIAWPVSLITDLIEFSSFFVWNKNADRGFIILMSLKNTSYFTMIWFHCL